MSSLGKEEGSTMMATDRHHLDPSPFQGMVWASRGLDLRDSR